MNWLIDAQLPARLARLLRERGEDALHTTGLPGGNRTPDAAILAVAARDDRIVVTKDADFVASFRVTGRPRRDPLRRVPRLIATGNIANPALDALILAALPARLDAFAGPRLVELHAGHGGAALLVIHP